MRFCQQAAKKPSWSWDSTETSLLDRLLLCEMLLCEMLLCEMLLCEIVSGASYRSKPCSSSGSGLSEVAEPVVAALTGGDEKGFVTKDEQEPPGS